MRFSSRLGLQPFNVKLAATLISILALGYLVIHGKDILSPLIFSALLAIVLLPVSRWLELKCRLGRSAAAMIAVMLLLALVSFVLYFVGAELAGLSRDWPMFKAQLGSSLDQFQAWIAQRFHIDEGDQMGYFHSATDKLLDSGTLVVGATIVSVSSMLLFLVFTFIYTFLFLVYRKLILKFFIDVFREEHAGVVHDVAEQVQYIIRKYIVGLLLEMAIVATVVSIAFSIMGVKYAILLGIITGLFNLIPYIGIFTALVISSLITFATAAVASTVILVAVTLIVVHIIDSNILLPIIVGSKVRINALVTLIGVVLGEMMWGIPGMFLSIPVIAVLKIIFDRVESLKPWGMLLGDEEMKKKEKKIEKVVHAVEEAIE